MLWSANHKGENRCALVSARVLVHMADNFSHFSSMENKTINMGSQFILQHTHVHVKERTSPVEYWPESQ